MTKTLIIGGHEFHQGHWEMPSRASAWCLRIGGMNFMFTHDTGASDGEWFGASKCASHGKVVTIAFSRDRTKVEEKLLEAIKAQAQ
jgi:hypothetical protein